MIDVKKAQEIYESHFPGFPVLACDEIEGFGYLFQTGIIALNDSVTIVSFEGEIKKINVSPFFGDADFAKAKRKNLF